MMDEPSAEKILSPRTPPSKNIGDPEDDSASEAVDDSARRETGKSRRKHRRAKGKKRKQKSSLMITTEDGSEFIAAGGSLPAKQAKINLRPTNNPLINAPRNSTQFIIDDHENSNLFWNFEANGPNDEQDGVILHHQQIVRHSERYSPDDDSFWTEYSERDFEDVYETAHQEEIFGWDKERIVREITAMEKRQNHLIDMLAAIDPVLYLEKLQDELLSLQEVNRQLKLVNIAEKLHRRENLERREIADDSDSDSRLPDSTSQDAEGGCASGCCLLRTCDDNCDLTNQERRLAEVDDVGNDVDPSSMEVDEGGAAAADEGGKVKVGDVVNDPTDENREMISSESIEGPCTVDINQADGEKLGLPSHADELQTTERTGASGCSRVKLVDSGTSRVNPVASESSAASVKNSIEVPTKPTTAAGTVATTSFPATVNLAPPPTTTIAATTSVSTSASPSTTSYTAAAKSASTASSDEGSSSEPCQAGENKKQD